MGCLDEERISGLVSGALAPADVDAARVHLGECVACRVLVAETAKSVEGSGSVDVDVFDTVLDDASTPGSHEPGELAPGDVIDGKYRIEGVLGRGGMGTVLSAVHLKLKFEVAIKVLKASMLSRRDIVGRFMREARAAARIKSPHVVSVLDVGGLPSGEPFIVMERLHGNDLSVELARRGRLPILEAVDYTIEICEAVAHAHATGVVHRDLKPANVFLCKAAHAPVCVKVLDFGISKISDPGGESGLDFSTEVQSWLGTPRYMAPEQITLGRKVDERADIWAIGTLLYELISGHPPFQDKSLEVLCKRLLEETPRPLQDESIDRLPRGLGEVVARCLEKSPAERYRTVGMLARAIAPHASRSKESTLQRIGALPGMGVDLSESTERPARARRAVAFGRKHPLGLGAILVGASALAWLGFSRTSVERAPPTPANEPEAVTMTTSTREAAPIPSVALPALSPPSGERDTPSATPSAGSSRRSPARNSPSTPVAKHPEFGGRL
jgi:eukaryotic-like serine/threonine-protein kinase